MKFPALLILSIFLASCSTVKRNGYYQTKRYKFGNGHSKAVHVKRKKSEQKSPKLVIPSIQTKEVSKPDKSDTRASILKEVKHMPSKGVKSKLTFNASISETKNDSCDNIIMKNGDEISGVVTEIGLSEIKYKKCSNQEGPTISLRKSDVLMIRYRNGTKDIINMDLNEPEAAEGENAQADPQSEKKSGSGIGVVLVIIGFVLFMFVSIVVGLVIMGIGFITLLATLIN